jgi:hypothetical protein
MSTRHPCQPFNHFNPSTFLSFTPLLQHFISTFQTIAISRSPGIAFERTHWLLTVKQATDLLLRSGGMNAMQGA